MFMHRQIAVDIVLKHLFLVTYADAEHWLPYLSTPTALWNLLHYIANAIELGIHYLRLETSAEDASPFMLILLCSPIAKNRLSQSFILKPYAVCSSISGCILDNLRLYFGYLNTYIEWPIARRRPKPICRLQNLKLTTLPDLLKNNLLLWILFSASLLTAICK